MSGANLFAVLGSNIPEGYLTLENVKFIHDKIVEVLKREFTQNINIDDNSIVKIMVRIAEQRLESIPRMNQRVVMEICSEFRQYQIDMNKHMLWEENYSESQKIYNMVGMLGTKDPEIKIRIARNGGKVGSTARFYFT